LYRKEEGPPEEFWEAAANDDDPRQKPRHKSTDQLQRENLELQNAKLKSEVKRNREPEPEPVNILTIAEILEQPDPVWLIESWLQEDSFAVLAGPSDTYKSFLAVDWACCVASDINWQRHKTEHGQALYVYAEGGKGMGKRLKAWRAAHKRDAENFHGIPHAVDLSSEKSVAGLIDKIKAKALCPKLLVIDTLNRCFGAGNENDTKDMSAFIHGCDKLRVAFPGCTVLVVHHCGWEAAHERGNSSLRGALDTLLQIRERQGDKIALVVKKQKDDEEDDRPMWLEAVKVPDTKSIVLALAEPPARTKPGDESEGKVMAALTEVFPKGLKPGELSVVSGVNPNTLSKGANNVRARLVQAGKTREENGRIFALQQNG